MQIGKFLIYRPKKGLTQQELESVDVEYEKGLASGKQLILGVLAARSGTRVLGDIFNAHENATGTTERYFEAESLYRYIKYNKLPIDTSPTITLIKHGIVADWKKGDIALVTSPFFSHGIKELYDALRPSRILFAINDPVFTVQSIYNKGFFKEKYVRPDANLALGFQPAFDQKWSWLYLFARLVPNGEFYHTWEKLTRIGKIAWWGNKMNIDIYEQLKQIPQNKIFIFKLTEALKDYYAYYRIIAKEFGLAPLLSEKKINQIRRKGVSKWHNKEEVWSDKEWEEFRAYTKEWYELCDKLSKNSFE